MNFLNPLLLFGAAAVSVPILIHLLNRRRVRRTVWAAMRFLQASIQQNQRRLQVEDWLLLVLRCLLVLLLALALARPVWQARGAAAAARVPATAVLLLDNSYSMGLSDGVRTRFEQARQAAEQILDALPHGSAVALWLVSDTVRPMIAEPSRDLALVRQSLRAARLSSRATDLWPGVQQAVEQLQRTTAARKELYLLTDGQALGWRNWDQLIGLLRSTRSTVRSHVVLVGDPPEQNLAITDLRLTSGLGALDQPLRFEVQVANLGSRDQRDVRLSLHVNDDPPSEEAILTDLPAGSVRSLSLFARLRGEGLQAVTARLPADRLGADDQRTIVVTANRVLRVLLVDGDPGREPRAAETFFLRHALVPVPETAAARHCLKTRVVSPAELASTHWEDYDAVVLANVFDLPATGVALLEQYVARGGGLLVFPGPNLNRAFYNEMLVKRQGLLPAAFGEAVGDAESQEQPVSWQDQDFEHPIVALWNDPAAGTLGSALFYRHYPLEPAAAPAAGTITAGPARVVLRYRDGSPAVMERDWGLGRVIQFSSTADTAWNDLPVRPAFVPLLYRALEALRQRQEDGLNVIAGQPFTRRVAADHLGADIRVRLPEGAPGARDFGRVELVGAVPLVRHGLTDQAGLYAIQGSGPLPLELKFAVQPNTIESGLLPVTAPQLSELAQVAELYRYPSELPLRDRLERAVIGAEFWVGLVWLALLLGMVELGLAQRFSRSR